MCLPAFGLWLGVHAAQVTSQAIHIMSKRQRSARRQIPITFLASALTLTMPPIVWARAHPPRDVGCDAIFAGFDVVARRIACALLRFRLRFRLDAWLAFQARGPTLPVPPFVVSRAHVPLRVRTFALGFRHDVNTCRVAYLTTASARRRLRSWMRGWLRRRGLHCRRICAYWNWLLSWLRRQGLRCRRMRRSRLTATAA